EVDVVIGVRRRRSANLVDAAGLVGRVVRREIVVRVRRERGRQLNRAREGVRAGDDVLQDALADELRACVLHVVPHDRRLDGRRSAAAGTGDAADAVRSALIVGDGIESKYQLATEADVDGERAVSHEKRVRHYIRAGGGLEAA